ncbi:MAG: hypothetical protein ACC726_12235 [Chloroflexota bacterium]
MSVARRLDRIEAELPPGPAVLHWLDEVQRSGSLGAYVSSLLEQPAAMAPFVAIYERARAAARRAHVGEPRALIRDAEHRAAMDVVFLLELVVELERVTTSISDRGTLRLGALRWELRARSAEGGVDRQGWAAWRSGVLELAIELARTELARHRLEERFLDGHAVLPPGTQATWGELSEGVAGLVSTLPSLPGGRRRRRPDRDVARAAERTAPDEAARIVEHARAQALDLLGDHATAQAIIEWALREETRRRSTIRRGPGRVPEALQRVSRRASRRSSAPSRSPRARPGHRRRRRASRARWQASCRPRR